MKEFIKERNELNIEWSRKMTAKELNKIRVKMKDAKERLVELIIEYSSTHPYRDWTIGVEPYSDIPMEQARKENLEHWSLLADAILKEFVRREDVEVCRCVYGLHEEECDKCNGLGWVAKGE